jgi:hypothetical protein
MTARQGILGVVVVGLVMLVLSLAGVASDFLTGIALNIDGLLLLAVSLMVALLFLAMLFFLAKTEGWFGKPKEASAPSAPAAKAQQPAPAK